jgi:hypothetical protein
MPTSTTKLVTADGTPTSLWVLLLNELLNRVGGSTGGIYSKLTVSSGTFTWDLTASPIAFVTLANGSNTMSALNPIAGNFTLNRLTVIQPSSGSKGTLVWPTNFFFPGGATPTLTVTNSGIDLFSFCSDGTNVYIMTEGINYSA